MILISPIGKVRVRSCAALRSSRAVSLPNDHQLVRIRERQRLEKDGVNDTEDGSVRADAQSERNRSDDAEAGRLEQKAYSIADVLPESFHDSFLRFLISNFRSTPSPSGRRAGLV